MYPRFSRFPLTTSVVLNCLFYIVVGFNSIPYVGSLKRGRGGETWDHRDRTLRHVALESTVIDLMKDPRVV